MNLNDDEAYDRKMEEIIVSLEVLYVIGAAVKRLLDNNAVFLQNVPNQNQDNDF